MSLKELAAILPGYAILKFHTEDKSWNMSAGVVAANDAFSKACVVKAIPLSSYTMEVSIKFKEVTE